MRYDTDVSKADMDDDNLRVENVMLRNALLQIAESYPVTEEGRVLAAIAKEALRAAS